MAVIRVDSAATASVGSLDIGQCFHVVKTGLALGCPPAVCVKTSEGTIIELPSGGRGIGVRVRCDMESIVTPVRIDDIFVSATSSEERKR